jgi:adenine-specific DNA glycosylase
MGCFAKKNQLQDALPRPKAAPTRKKITYLCAILERRGKILTARRPLSGLLPGLWEFPGGESLNGEPKEKALARLLRERLGIGAKIKALPLRIQQTLTHREINIHPFRGRFIKGQFIPIEKCPRMKRPLLWRRPLWYREIRWVAKENLKRLALTSGMLKLAKQL